MTKRIDPPKPLRSIEGKKTDKAIYAPADVLAYLQARLPDLRMETNREACEQAISMAQNLIDKNVIELSLSQKSGFWAKPSNILGSLEDAHYKSELDNSKILDPGKPKPKEATPPADAPPAPEPEPGDADPENKMITLAPLPGDDEPEAGKGPKLDLEDPAAGEKDKKKQEIRLLAFPEFQAIVSVLPFGADVTCTQEDEHHFKVTFPPDDRKFLRSIEYMADDAGRPMLRSAPGMNLDDAHKLLELSAATLGPVLQMTNPNMTVEDKEKLYIATQTHNARKSAFAFKKQIEQAIEIMKQAELDPKSKQGPIILPISPAMDDFLKGGDLPVTLSLLDGANGGGLYVPPNERSQEIADEISKENEMFRKAIQGLKAANAFLFAEPETVQPVVLSADPADNQPPRGSLKVEAAASVDLAAPSVSSPTTPVEAAKTPATAPAAADPVMGNVGQDTRRTHGGHRALGLRSIRRRPAAG